MKRLKRLWVPIWLAPRAYWSLAAVALLLAAGSAHPALLLVAKAAAAACVLLLFADFALLPASSRVRITRLSPEPFAMRRRGSITYCIANPSRIALRAGIVESPVPFLHFIDDETGGRVPPGAELRVERAVMPVARGSGGFETMYAWYQTPLGLLRRRLRIESRAPLRVYPDLSAVERYGSLHVRNRLIEAGLRRMRLRGLGTEPESVREWASGDPFRSINWKATARTGKVMVAQYEVERSQNVMILLDAGRLMMPLIDAQRKFDYAITAALSVAAIASLANDKVGLVAFAGSILRAQAPRQSGRSLERLTREMHDIEPRFEEADYEAAFAYVRAHVQKRSLIIFFTDMVDPAAQAAVLANLGTLSRRHVVVCAFMNDAAVDSALEREPVGVREAYLQTVALELRDERKAAAATLTHMGVRVIDVPARALTSALIDRYLQIKQRGQL